MNTARIEMAFNANIGVTKDKAALEAAVEDCVMKALKDEAEARVLREEARAQALLVNEKKVSKIVEERIGTDLLLALQASVKTNTKPGGAFEVHYTLRYKGSAFGLMVYASTNMAGEIYDFRYVVNGISLDDLTQCKGEIYETLFNIEHGIKKIGRASCRERV